MEKYIVSGRHWPYESRMYLGKSGLVGYSALIFFNETGTENGKVYNHLITRGAAMNEENTEQRQLY